MKIKKTKTKKEENFLLLKDNESITILADKELKSSINIMCKNKKLLINLLETEPKKDFFQNPSN